MARISLDPPRTLRYRAAAWIVLRMYGKELDPVRAMGHHMGVSTAYSLFEIQAQRWKALPHRYKDLAEMAAAVRIGCSWCVDFGTWAATTHGIPLEKLEAVPAWRDSDLFDREERLVLEYADAMCADPPEVTDELTAELRTFLDERQLVELTMMVAVENLRSRFNAAAGLTGQGFKDRCDVPANRAAQGDARAV
ncbi:carboxymuconolactone decarboxylase family protein [Actinomadura harenae]|uniref:Carboxymuconolactone decarboxylase family protein n=1 Tax=Actinomadura harenae TaxID=2483351 RepID=A0A3M2LQN8_9ACTN|nr:carboxymuconolactone decarboxylase family protein [Actinomadura harenae]RMI38405.1 carboxymuconolactone decarboxylase family protein [Actinomadura harenae]